MTSRLLSLIIALALSLTSNALAAPKSYGTIKLPTSAVTSIYDADTFFITIPEWPSIAGERIGIRVNGIDAPELKSKCKNKAAKTRERKMGQTAKKHTVAAIRQSKIIELRNMRRGKFFRIVADVYVDGHSLAKYLISKGQARPYNGKSKREGWCRG